MGIAIFFSSEEFFFQFWDSSKKYHSLKAFLKILAFTIYRKNKNWKENKKK